MSKPRRTVREPGEVFDDPEPTLPGFPALPEPNEEEQEDSDADPQP